MQSLTRYLDTMTSNQLAVLEDSNHSAVVRLQALFASVIDVEEGNRREGRSIGCLGVNSSIELSRRDPEVAGLLQRDLERRLAALRDSILYGAPRVGEGEIARHRDPAIPCPFSQSACSLKPLTATPGGSEFPEGWQPHDAQASAKQFAIDGYLGPEHGRLMVQVEDEAAGFVTWDSRLVRQGDEVLGDRDRVAARVARARHRVAGAGNALRLPPHAYAGSAGTHPENIAEQKSLEKARFQLEGVIRAAEFRAGEYCDGFLYRRLQQDPQLPLA